jgi:tetratricopeptide (TPR) repeat protein
MENIFIPDGCLSEGAIFRYLGNDLSEDESNAVQKHLAECEMCSDAMEGYRLMPDKDKALKMLAAIREEIASLPVSSPAKKNNTAYHRFFAYAATLVLICGTALILYQNLKKQETTIISKLNHEQQIPDTLKKQAEADNEMQTGANSGPVALQDNTVEKSKDVAGETKSKYFQAPMIVREEENKEVDKTEVFDRREIPVTVSDGETEQKIPLRVEGAKSLNDSDLNGKREDKPSDILVAGQDQNVNQEVVVVSAQKKEKTRSSTSKNGKASSAQYKNDIPKVAAGDEISMKADEKVQEDVLEEHTGILKKNPADYSSLYYSGVSYFNLKKYKKCIKQLDKVIEVKNAEFYEDALWYKAQALIALNKKEEAIPILDLIISGGAKYTKQAEAKKEEIR